MDRPDRQSHVTPDPKANPTDRRAGHQPDHIADYYSVVRGNPKKHFVSVVNGLFVVADYR
jgi:hypothetical protein